MIRGPPSGLDPVDVLVLNEFVDGPGRGWFRACLDRVGLGHQVLPHTTALHNQVLIAAREPIFVGDLQAPTFDGSARSNFLHVVLSSVGLELVGLESLPTSPLLIFAPVLPGAPARQPD